jgi:hypothetical protein
LFAVAGDTNGLDELLFAKMSQVAVAWIARPIVTVAEVASGHHAKRSDRSQGTAFRTSQGVFAVPGIADNLPVASAGQIKTAREDVGRLAGTVARLTFTLGPANVLGSIAVVGTIPSGVPLVVAFSIVIDVRGTRAASRRHHIVIKIPIVPVARIAGIALVT